MNIYSKILKRLYHPRLDLHKAKKIIKDNIDKLSSEDRDDLLYFISFVEDIIARNLSDIKDIIKGQTK